MLCHIKIITLFLDNLTENAQSAALCIFLSQLFFYYNLRINKVWSCVFSVINVCD